MSASSTAVPTWSTKTFSTIRSTSASSLSPVKTRQIEMIPFREDRLVAICHPDHPLANQTIVEVDALADYKFISFDPDIPTRKAIDQIFRDNMIEIEPVMEFDNIETVKRAVEIDAGIALVPQATVAQEVKQGTLSSVALSGSGFTRPLAILHRKGRVLTPAMKKFIKTLTGKEVEST